MVFSKMGKMTEERENTRKMITIILLAIFLIVIVGSISGYIYISNALKAVDEQSNKTIEVTIPVGSSVYEIGQILEENKVIKDSRVFRFYTRFTNKGNFKAGKYKLSPAMDLKEIISILQQGSPLHDALFKITIPEGSTVDEIASIFSKHLAFTKDDFIKKANDKKYIKKLLKKYPKLLTEEILQNGIHTPLEGYLFAATYEFDRKDTKIEHIIEKMLDKSEEVILPYEKEIKRKNFTLHEAVTFASIIEKETGMRDQRKEIAGVFYNRLNKNMPLQTDPTVLYALGKHKEKITLNDLKVDSPYNTYIHPNLPIGAISNFGVHALEATVKPKKTDYMYFLHDEKGEIYFSKSHDEHVKKKKKYIK